MTYEIIKWSIMALGVVLLIVALVAERRERLAEMDTSEDCCDPDYDYERGRYIHDPNGCTRFQND